LYIPYAHQWLAQFFRAQLPLLGLLGLESEVKENEKKSLFFMAYGNSWGTIGCLDVLQPNL
jgi:hypothetical protein